MHVPHECSLYNMSTVSVPPVLLLTFGILPIYKTPVSSLKHYAVFLRAGGPLAIHRQGYRQKGPHLGNRPRRARGGWADRQALAASSDRPARWHGAVGVGG